MVMDRVKSSGHKVPANFTTLDVSEASIWNNVSQKNGFLESIPHDMMSILVY